MVTRPVRIGVIGAGRSYSPWDAWAAQVGLEIAKKGAILVCGGLSGVMAAAARGAREAGGTTLGILPGTDAEDANPDITIPIPTGLGEGRNLLVVQSSDALIAIGGGAGTLSEIGFSLKLHKPLILLGSWQLTPPPAVGPSGRASAFVEGESAGGGVTPPEGAQPLKVQPRLAKSPQEACDLAFQLAGQRR